MRKDEYLRHIREPEKITMLRHILDLAEISSRNYRAAASDFLDPYEQRLVALLAHHFPEVELFFEPQDERERKIAVFVPYAVESDFLSAFFLEGGEVFDHRNVLGSLLGLGIERGKIGDIVSVEDGAYVFVKKEVAHFIELSLSKVGSVPVRVREYAVESVPEAREAWVQNYGVVASMRLDAVVRAVTRHSRDEVRNLVAKGLVKINFKPANKVHEVVEPGDLISVRGFGRIKIFDPVTATKKGKVRFCYGTLDSR
ncbi:MAG: YlmH/Sll1252 family protein [Peptoniphilus sp.]|nr:YlmH/Sll1252 family protein [Peptoniphilus sp.]MDY3118030.1 YlmH/Sll1252 family protein [Peptoniphilus sp.]